MKTIYKTIFIPFVFVGLFTQCDFGTDVELLEISDDAFLDALIQVGVDSDGDGGISAPEAEVITWMNVSGEYLNGQPGFVGDITDLTGIEAFINLDTLICSFNQIAHLNISGFTRLIKLDCMENPLTTLDVSRNVVLQDLNCSQNLLTTLDVSNNTNLTTLGCYSNQLSSLDVSSLHLIEYLDCSNNQISDLDVSLNPELRSLLCGDNKLTNLDISHNPALVDLFCSENLLTSLDVSIPRGLLELYCDANQFSSLNVSNNVFLIHLDLSDMPSLYEVCVWSTPFPPRPTLTVITDNSPNIYFTTECSK